MMNFCRFFLPQPPPEGEIGRQSQIVPLWRGLGEERPLNIYFLLLLLHLISGCTTSSETNDSLSQTLPEKVDFNYHIKPILSDRCFACHGPDANKREADLRLDQEDQALNKLLESGQHAFVAGDPEASEAYLRMISDDPDLQMPPPDSKLSLDEKEIALIQKWIEQGAEYKPHWAFIPPQKASILKLEAGTNEIDFFVRRRLKAQHLSPNPPSDKEVLLRRAYLDLTGLPPNIGAIDAFLADSSSNAFEKVVDQLLASEAYGERMAMDWMDVARYADSHGYSQDGFRRMWPWRDWAIQAFNENMPFDQFLIWQMAGDLLPDATRTQRLATAFYRNHRINSEGGIVPEEYRVEYVAERTNMTATAFMGLTMECARCHDHKYDPFSQKDYYRLSAFFNSVNERGLVQKDGNSGPAVFITNEAAEKQIAWLNRQIVSQKNRIREYRKKFKVVDLPATLPEGLRDEGRIGHYLFDEQKNQESPNKADKNLRARLDPEVLLVDGKKGKAVQVNAHDVVNLGKMAQFERSDAFSISCWVNLQSGGKDLNVLFNLAGKNEGFYGYQLFLENKQPQFRLVHGLPADLIQVGIPQQLKVGEWYHLTVAYDGSGKAEGVNLFLNGLIAEKEVVFDQLTQSIKPDGRSRNLRLGGYLQDETDIDSGAVVVDELSIYDRQISQPEVMALYDQVKVRTLPPDRWKTYFLASDSAYRKKQHKLHDLISRRNAITDTLKTVMVMEDLPKVRPTFMLDRGQYDAHGEEVFPHTPEQLPALPSSLPKNRLGLAQWLVHPDHPLTARVTVNRYWQMIMGRGLVKTPDDFGSQGALPSHPELLDWLAVDFMQSGWDVKALVKKIVMSATYQQSSQVAPEKRNADPENVFLARGPSFRLSAEMIRDQALAASGLLVREIGGPSVKPYQPPGLWSEKNTFSVILRYYVQDHGDKLYRRSMYTFWRRTSTPPNMATFDAPTRDFCTVRRQRTSTPLQALVLLNDPQFVEAARVLGERMLKEGGESLREQIVFAYRRLTGKQPLEENLDLLEQFFEQEYAALKEEPDRATAFLEVGEYALDEGLEPCLLAASSMTAHAIMNLDAFIFKR